MKTFKSDSLPWGIVDAGGDLLFDYEGRAHIYWNRANARTAVWEGDWSAFQSQPTIKRIDWVAK